MPDMNSMPMGDMGSMKEDTPAGKEIRIEIVATEDGSATVNGEQVESFGAAIGKAIEIYEGSEDEGGDFEEGFGKGPGSPQMVRMREGE